MASKIKQQAAAIRLRWGAQRKPSKQIRIDADVAERMIREIPEADRRNFASSAISEAMDERLT